MKKVFSLSIIIMSIFISNAFAGYIFQSDMTSEGQKTKMAYMTDGENRRIDVYINDDLSTSIIATPARTETLYLMHDSKSYMNGFPKMENFSFKMPEINYEDTKRAKTAPEKIDDAINKAEKTKQRISDFKNDPWSAAQETSGDLAAKAQEKQQEKMMKEQFAKMQEMQKSAQGQIEQQQRMIQVQMERERKKKNAVLIKDFAIKPTDKKSRIGNYNAKLVQVYYQGELFQDQWLTNDVDADATKAFTGFATEKLFEKDLAPFYKTMRTLGEKIYSNGFPVKTVSYFKGKTLVLGSSPFGSTAPSKMEMEITKIEKKSIKGEEFAPPKGYEELKM